MGYQTKGNELTDSATTISQDILAGESYSNAANMGILSHPDKPSYAAIVSKDLSAEKPDSNGALMGNMEHGNEQIVLSAIPQEDPHVAISFSNGGLKDNNAHRGEQSYPTKPVSGDVSTGASYSNGTFDKTKEAKQGYPATTAPEGVITDNGNKTGSMLPAPGDSVTKPVSPIHSASPISTIQSNQNIHDSEKSHTADIMVDLGVQGIDSSRRRYDWDILKSIIYGGLIELITSLTLVAAAAGSGSSTLHICALGLANLIGGLFLIAHDLSELRSAHDAEATNLGVPQASQYWLRLGKREHIKRHTFFAILSYIIFGLLPPIVYAFTFRKSDNKEHKILAMTSSSLFCIAFLAIGKGHVRPQKDYMKSLFYYLAIALPASGISYAAGVMINRLCLDLGLFDSDIISPSPPSSIELLKFGSQSATWQAI